MSILSALPDGMNFYYGYLPNDYRQINVRREGNNGWVAYVGGEQIGIGYDTRLAAEKAAVTWATDNPPNCPDEETT